MRTLHLLLTTTLVLNSLAASAAPPKTGSTKRPKLILLVVFDQFRADYLMRFQSQFKPALGAGGEVGGFQYLMSKGAYYPYGEYDILQAMTGPGHATTLSGSYPYQNGVAINYWYNQGKQSGVYCAEDLDQATVGATPKNPHVGTSPRNLIGSTVGDELKHGGYPSRVVSLALKDRAAIFMGGHRADLAMWFDPENFKWVSSKYYLADGKLPKWVDQINDGIAQAKGKTFTWEAKGQGGGLSLLDPMILPGMNRNAEPAFESDGGFKHPDKIGTRSSINMPYGAVITEAAAERAMDEYKLGTGKATDLLAVSFSSHDYAAHTWGPNSRQLEEMTLVEDQLLSQLLNHVRKKVPGGLDNVVIALTADHGAPPNPTWLKSQRVQADRINENEIAKALNDKLTKKFGKIGGGAVSKDPYVTQDAWLSYVSDFNFYINRTAAEAKEINPTLIENEVRNYLLTLPGIAQVFTATDYRERKLPPGMHQRQILKTFYPGRSGDVIVIPKPYFMADGDTVSHHTGYAYDRTVPIILAGAPFKAGKYSSKAEVIDIAPTLTFISGAMPPALSEGRVLTEALGQ